MAPFPEVGCEFHIVKDPFKMNVTPAKISNYAICNAYALYSVKWWLIIMMLHKQDDSRVEMYFLIISLMMLIMMMMMKTMINRLNDVFFSVQANAE